jgi:signal transduction histidine kinase
MRRPLLSFHTRLTLTIASAFIGAMLVILALALLAAENFDLAIVSTSFNAGEPDVPDVPDIPDIATPSSDRSEIPEPAEPPDPLEPAEPGEDTLVPGAIYVVDQDGQQGQVVQFPEDRLPTLMRWSFVVLFAFAIVAVALASWISRRSLGRIASITSLARGLSEQQLDQRLNLTGPDDEIKQLGDTFDGMLERLERVFTNQSLFIANASHELRTPLTTVRAALEIPMIQGRVPVDLQPSIERALAASQRSEELIAALLLLARGRLTRPDRQEIDLAELVRSALDAHRAAAHERGITIHANLEPVIVSGNTTLLAEAVDNLVENAVRHNADKGEVWVTLDAAPAGAQLAVENTGATYAAEDVARLADPFHRHDATRLSGTATTPGFGLGLAIVKSVIDMHGGSLTLAPRDGGGIFATVVVPYGEDERPSPPERDKNRP